MNTIWKLTRKEFNHYFASPAAYLFLGAFLVVSLFVFFWAEGFYARNIADLKPLFRWMPVLLIFLVAAITMRSWSEERRSGTLELLLTSPVRPLDLILGKFLAGWALVALALFLTLPLPVTVGFLGPLDWGPVIGGYLAALFLSAAYVAIGLFLSARTDNPMVSLILTVACAGIFYLIGSPLLTTMFGYRMGGFLELLGTGSRFESITRGVLDLRDLYYYISLIGIFLTLNLWALERVRWAGNPDRAQHRRWNLLALLITVNFLLPNFWLQPLGWARVDLTENRLYTLSSVTRQHLDMVQEPLLIRGYFSSKSHPLLEPLIPHLQDLLKEYQTVGGRAVRVEFVDPHESQEIQEEAAERYGIRPVPFRVSSRYESGVVNSYFDLLIRYGDQYELLSFEDLIEVKARADGTPEVLLNNPEYAITRAIRKVIRSYRSEGDLFAEVDAPITLHGYVSPSEELPDQLVDVRRQLEEVLASLAKDSNGKFTYEFSDPEAGDGALAEQLQRRYGFGPQVASLFSNETFWFYLMLEKANGETEQIPLPTDLTGEQLRKAIEAAIQRMTSGLIKTVAVMTPPPPSPQSNPYGPRQQRPRFQQLRNRLEENVRLVDTNLREGRVPTNAELLLLLGPENLKEKQLFAIDQFLMQGGTVVVLSSPFEVRIGQGLNVMTRRSGLKDWLDHFGIQIPETMVLDLENNSLPVPVRRQMGPLAVNEIRMMPYPHFLDVRGKWLKSEHPVSGGLEQLTVAWVSPVQFDGKNHPDFQWTPLLQSSEKSWESGKMSIIPDYEKYPVAGYPIGEEQGIRTLAGVLEGPFDSFFKGSESPLLDTGAEAGAESGTEKGKETSKGEPLVVSGIIESASESARLVVLPSRMFVRDTTLELISQGRSSRYTAPVDYLQNIIDWSLDDSGLVSIRSGSRFARTLVPLDRKEQEFWEYLNYGLALSGLGFLALVRLGLRRQKNRHYSELLAKVKPS